MEQISQPDPSLRSTTDGDTRPKRLATLLLANRKRAFDLYAGESVPGLTEPDQERKQLKISQQYASIG